MALLRLGYEQAQGLRHRAADAGRRPAGLDRILEAAPVMLIYHAAQARMSHTLPAVDSTGERIFFKKKAATRKGGRQTKLLSISYRWIGSQPSNNRPQL